MASDTHAAERRDDLVTVAGLGVIAACVSMVAHEALGHGLECLAIGGRITRLTNALFTCQGQDAFTSIAGPIGNLVVGALAALFFSAISAVRPRLKLLALFVAAFSLFWEAGYMLYAAVKGEGDYVYFLHDVGAPAVFRPLLGVSGLLLYVVAIALVGRGVGSFGATRARRLLWPAWLGGVLAAVGAAALYAPARLAAIHDAALEIGGASIPLLIIPFRLWSVPGAPSRIPAIGRSLAWIGAAVVVFAALAATLGRGLSS
jgi:hypothetical protein